jgi:hypothetical protein
MKKRVQEIEQAAIAELAMQIGEFSESFAERTASIETGALDAIEDDWTCLHTATEKAYERMVGDLIDSVDERDMISKKKRNGKSAE